MASSWLLLCLMQLSLALATPDVYWSMNKTEGNRLYPDAGNATVWETELNAAASGWVSLGGFGISTAATFTNSIHQAALVLDHFKLRVGMPLNFGCLFDLTTCEEGGISVSMWLNIQQWSLIASSVFTTSEWPRLTTGISLYEDLDDLGNFTASVFLPGKTYFAAFNRDLISERWSHVTMTWSESNGVKLYINGTEVSIYTQGPGSRSVVTSAPTLQLEVGDFEMEMLMDEIGVWYRELTSDEVFSVARNGIDVTCTTTISTITTTNDTPNVTSTDETSAIEFTATSTEPSTPTTTQTTSTATEPSTSATIPTASTTTTTTTETSTTTQTTSTPNESSISTTTQSTTLAKTTDELFASSDASTVQQDTTIKSSVQTIASDATETAKTTTIIAKTSTLVTTENPPWNFWKIETIIAVSLCVGVALSAFLTSLFVFCCLLRRRRSKKSRSSQ